MNRRFWITLLIVLLAVPLRTHATQMGSIRLIMKHNGNTVSGGTVTLYEITQWGCDSDWDAKRMAEHAKDNRIPGFTKQIGQEGIALFPNLGMGQYLLVQWEASEGYLPMEPFVVAIPLMIDGEGSLDILAEPKLRPLSQEKLPQTGQLQWPAWLMGGMGILLAGAGIIIYRKE